MTDERRAYLLCECLPIREREGYRSLAREHPEIFARLYACRFPSTPPPLFGVGLPLIAPRTAPRIHPS